MLRVIPGGDTRKTDSFLDSILNGGVYSKANLGPIAQRGVDALAAATPRDTGDTAAGWYYEIHISGSKLEIWWCNSHVVDGFPVAIGLQYGHGTGTGGWVDGIDFINPSLRAIFDQIADAVWKEVQNA